MIKAEEIIIAIDKMDSLLRLSLELLLVSTNILETKITIMLAEQYAKQDSNGDLIQNFGAIHRSISNKNVSLFASILKVVNFDRGILARVVEEFINDTDIKIYINMSKNMSANSNSYPILDCEMSVLENKFGGVRSTLYGCYRNCVAYYEKYKELRNDLILSISELAKMKSKKYNTELREDVFQSMVMGIIVAIDRMKANRMAAQKNSVLKFIKMYMKGAIKSSRQSKDILLEDMSDIPYQSKTREHSIPILSKQERFLVGLIFLDPTVGKSPSKQDIEMERVRQAL